MRPLAGHLAGVVTLFVWLPGVAALAARAIVPAPSTFVLDGAISEWKGIPGFEQSTDESIWFAQTRDGLIVAGEVRGASPDFAKNKSELRSKAHLSLKVSLVDSIHFPDLMYTENRCPQGSGEEAIKCAQWVRDQQTFRDNIQRLFTRVWEITPGVVAETSALPVFNSLTDGQQAALHLLRPAGLPASKFQVNAASTTFEILVPWTILPPAERLIVDRVKIRLEGGVGLNVESFIDPMHSLWPGELPEVELFPPRVSEITRCRQPLVGRTLAEDDAPAYYFLTDSGIVDSAFFFENPLKPYMPPLPREGDLSPVIGTQEFFSQQISTNEFLCGPYLSYRKGTVARRFPTGAIFEHNGGFGIAPPLPLKRLRDGSLMIEYGPKTWHGALWTKAFIVYSIRFYVVTPSLDVYEALALGAWSDRMAGYSVEISDDWNTVTEFKELDYQGKWTAENFCLQGHLYHSCGKNPDSRPPKERVFGDGN